MNNYDVRVIMATEAFGLSFNKPDVQLTEMALPPSVSAWVQEYDQAGRAGKQAHVYILYCDNDI